MVKSSFDVIIKKSFLFLFLFLYVTCRLIAQPTLSLDWEYKEAIGRSAFIKRDYQGDIITIGTGGNNIFGNYVNLLIVKHDSAGNLLWERSFEDTIGGLMLPYDFKLDSLNNIYVCGRAHNNSQFKEGFLVKYDANGNFKWNGYYGAAQNMAGEFNKMTIFNNRSIYVAGKMDSLSGLGNRMAFLNRYDANGNLIWAKADSLAYNQEGKMAEVDKYGNPYLIGYTSCCAPGGKMFVEKFDSIGNKIWRTVVIDTTYQFGYPICSTIDDSSNVYIGGDVQGLNVTSGFDSGVLKIDSNGNILWFSKFISSPSNQVWETPLGIIVDNNLNCYVYGNAYGAFIVKYDKKGIQKWNKLGNGANGNNYFVLIKAFSISQTELIIGGYGNSQAFPNNFITISLDTAGNNNWSAYFPYQNNSNTSGFIAYDSAFYFAGGISDTNFVLEDSLFVKKFNFSFANRIIDYTKAQSLLIFPNPFTSAVTLDWQDLSLSNVKIIIRNSLGEISIFEKTTKPSIFNLEHLSKGVYFVELYSNDRLILESKMVKY
ncbi:MAG: T9SS type A sorting domain-containing protein [Bacteroidetes bacterium]|nr:T9SS type A sorting domain-containing protein [Bacteroidota bacterium]